MSKKTYEYYDSVIPFFIVIENLTDEKLFNIPVLNWDNDNPDKVRYSTKHSSFKYHDFLEGIKSEEFRSGKISMDVFAPFDVYAERQATCCIKMFNSDEKGRTLTTPVFFPAKRKRRWFEFFKKKNHLSRQYYNTLNFQHHIDSYSNIILEHLMPESKVIIGLYPMTTVTTK